MQAEAVRKVRELHSRSKNISSSKLNKIQENTEYTTKENSHTKKAPQNPNLNNSNIKKTPNLIELLFNDSDKTLLIVLIVLLMDDKENFYIVLVLLYLLI